MYPTTFEGLLTTSHSDWKTFTRREFTPKTLTPHDVDIKVTTCGICSSDIHTANGGWGDAHLPLCLGHEIVGTVVKIGDRVTTVKLGDRVGVGAQAWACLDCEVCTASNEQYCEKYVDTYNGVYPDGSISQGGLASHVRVHEHFVFSIPDSLSSSAAAPMLCAGLTTYSALVRNGCGPGLRVAVVGIGGLGHFALQWARALGAETVAAISRSGAKRDDAMKLGASVFIDSAREDWTAEWKRGFDLVLNTANVAHRDTFSAYLDLLAVNGTFHTVGLPETPLPALSAQDIVLRGIKIGGSNLGSRVEMLAMLKLAGEKGIGAWVEEMQVNEGNCKEVMERMQENRARYRYALVGFESFFAV
ncbi:hypothetical protein ASPZODRAFT_157935 [Penicilliopsis zonata CBS 506.65]|uniref:Enoyl reductase (ER) domain-containing protein n=1 Tax=Penicilliopsis zonata CBS 506.65 TaxID=1073090 RepID=A0A1L9SLY1_9EURO|nr:hypothetical protein ASPZODRAFT_157935 [Penicilliopsis zonata CBS 506.65]OJJ48143.1 hypothetical protein ASPZODRAFT_157935 [Penicilliopsis zonata CBS 506.65]